MGRRWEVPTSEQQGRRRSPSSAGWAGGHSAGSVGLGGQRSREEQQSKVGSGSEAGVRGHSWGWGQSQRSWLGSEVTVGVRGQSGTCC